MKAYYCEGGPLDGQVQSAGDGVTHFRVQEWPLPQRGPASPVIEANATYRSSLYLLERQGDRLVWVYQG